MGRAGRYQHRDGVGDGLDRRAVEPSIHSNHIGSRSNDFSRSVASQTTKVVTTSRLNGVNHV
jgi:hypothetical protein